MSAAPGQPAPRAVVFDLDGTLVDSMPLVLRSVAHAIAPFMPPPPPEEIYRRLAGPSDRCMAELLGGDEHVPAAVERLLDYAGKHGDEVVVFDGAFALIDALRERGVPIGIWTGRDEHSARGILDATKLGARFATVVFGDSFDSHKPDPEGLLSVAKQLGVSPSEVVLVGDAEVDVLGAHGAGARSILIRQQREVSAPVLALGPQVVRTPEEAYALVRTLVGLG